MGSGKNKGLTTARVCTILGISKSTLFRWEREGKIPQPTRGSARKNAERQYTPEDFQKVQAWRMKDLFNEACEKDSLESQGEALEAISLQKVMAHDPFGIEELVGFSQRKRLSGAAIKELLRFAYENLDPSDQDFRRIVEVVWESCRQGSAASAGSAR